MHIFRKEFPGKDRAPDKPIPRGARAGTAVVAVLCLGVVTRAHGNKYLVTGPSMHSDAPSTCEFVIAQVYDKGPSPYKSLGTAFRTIIGEEGARALYQVPRPQTCMYRAYELYHNMRDSADAWSCFVE